MSESGLIVFVRNPILGKVKTRLARDLGSQRALELYIQMLEHTRDETMNLSVDKYIFYEDYINKNDLWSEPPYSKKLQQGATLGERMKLSFKSLFEMGYQRLVIIGSDCLELTTNLLCQAFEKLVESELIIGPAKDGGYYLLGMNRFIPEAFTEKRWGTSDVFERTIADLNSVRANYGLLPTLSDIDTVSDLQEYFSEKSEKSKTEL